MAGTEASKRDGPPSVRVRDDPAAARQALCDCVTGGGVALFPADTVYGLACDPLHPGSAERLRALKGRDPDKPNALMYFDVGMLRELVLGLGPRASAAAGALLPGPVTLVLPNPGRRYPLACGPDPERVGVRLVEGPLAGAGCVVMQTSANPSGGPDPRRIEDVDPAILGAVNLVLDAGELPGTPSTVIDVSRLDSGGDWTVLREGALPAAEVQRRLAPLQAQ